MGAACQAACTGKKYSKPQAMHPVRVIMKPTIHDLSSSMDDFEIHLEARSDLLAPKIDQKDAKVGMWFQEELLLSVVPKACRTVALKKSRMEKWRQMISYGLDAESVRKVFLKTPTGNSLDPIEFSSYAVVGLKNFYRHHPEKLRDRIRKGPPPAYRWLAWRFIGSRILGKCKGRYENNLKQGENNEWLYVIDKDLNRTFPSHSFFDISQNGGVGQKALRNILQAYAVYNEEIGYCQSMNFIVGFILMVSGSREKESFWFFCALLTKHKITEPVMCGLNGFFSDGFPTLLRSVQVFHVLFAQHLPELSEHLSDLPDLLWINKWFQTCFLYSFPLGLCIRIWDNIMADGTKFFFKAALAILKLVESELITLDFSEINEYFKSFNEKHSQFKLLPDYEKIISESYKFKITDQTIVEITQTVAGNISSQEAEAQISVRGPEIIVEKSLTPTPPKIGALTSHRRLNAEAQRQKVRNNNDAIGSSSSAARLIDQQQKPAVTMNTIESVDGGIRSPRQQSSKYKGGKVKKGTSKKGRNTKKIGQGRTKGADSGESHALMTPQTIVEELQGVASRSRRQSQVKSITQEVPITQQPENLKLEDVSAEYDNNQGVQNQQASDNLRVEGSSGGECKSQSIKVVTYDDILKPKKSSHPGTRAPQQSSKSQQDHIDALSLKSEDARRHTIHRGHMIFGSVSQRDYEVPKQDKMNRSQMSHQSGPAKNIPPVQIQNLNKQPTANNYSSSNEVQSLPQSESEKIDLNMMSLTIQPQVTPQQRHLMGSNVRTPEPRMLPQTNTTSSSIYKQLHKHKRLAGIGLRFNNSSQQRDAIHEAEEDQADEADEIREDNKEESEESDDEEGSQEEDSEDGEDSQRAESLNDEGATNEMTPVQWHQNLQTGDQVSQDSQPRGEGEESEMCSPSQDSRLVNLQQSQINLKRQPPDIVNSDSVASFVAKLPI